MSKDFRSKILKCFKDIEPQFTHIVKAKNDKREITKETYKAFLAKVFSYETISSRMIMPLEGRMIIDEVIRLLQTNIAFRATAKPDEVSGWIRIEMQDGKFFVLMYPKNTVFMSYEFFVAKTLGLILLEIL